MATTYLNDKQCVNDDIQHQEGYIQEQENIIDSKSQLDHERLKSIITVRAAGDVEKQNTINKIKI